MLDAPDIKAIREKLGMTQTEFAFALGKSASTVISWEVGRRHPTWNAMKSINELVEKHHPNGKPKKAG